MKRPAPRGSEPEGDTAPLEEPWSETESGALIGSLMRLLHVLQSAFARSIRAREVAPWEALILMSVHRRRRLRLSDLSRKSGIPPSTLTGMVDRLEAAGLVRRARDPDDRGGVVVEETADLASWMVELYDIIERDLGPRLAALPPGLVARLAADVRTVASCFEVQPAETQDDAPAQRASVG
jgi:DNA-binding MarR family transcriptional regulator